MRRLLARNETLVSLVLAAVCLGSRRGRSRAFSRSPPCSICCATASSPRCLRWASSWFSPPAASTCRSPRSPPSRCTSAPRRWSRSAWAIRSSSPSLVAGAIGLALGLINGFFIATLRLPTLIVTLGTLNVFRGFLLTFVGTQLITAVPIGMRTFSRTMLVRLTDADGADRLAADRLSAGGGGRGADRRSSSIGRCSGGASMRSAARRSRRFASASTSRGCSISSTPMSGCSRASPASSMRRWRGWRTRSTSSASNCR